MTIRLAVSIGLAAVTAGYLLVQFVALVLQDATIEREVGEDAAYDAETAYWLTGLRSPDSEFDAWCQQAIALTREPADQDIELWDAEIEGAS